MCMVERGIAPHMCTLPLQLAPSTDISGFLSELLTKTREFEDRKKVSDTISSPHRIRTSCTHSTAVPFRRVFKSAFVYVHVNDMGLSPT